MAKIVLKFKYKLQIMQNTQLNHLTVCCTALIKVQYRFAVEFLKIVSDFKAGVPKPQAAAQYQAAAHSELVSG